MIMGPPGSGKSTLARHLGARHGLPVFHLDQIFHQPGWVPIAKEAFCAEVERIAALPEWVIDGNYTDAIAPRYQNADTMIYLDVSRWVSMSRVVRRLVSHYGRVRPDGPKGCPERLDLEFLRFVWTWNQIRRGRTLPLFNEFRGTVMVLRGVSQQKRFQALLIKRERVEVGAHASTSTYRALEAERLEHPADDSTG
jgi:adenylate kinase family enzyme